MPAQKPEEVFKKIDPVRPTAPQSSANPFSYNPFTGPLFEPVTMGSVGKAASSLGNLLNPFSSAQRLAASAGGAIGTAAMGLATGQIPLMGRTSGDRGVAAVAPQLPSGAMGTGFDVYSSKPTMAPSAPTKFPYGSALGPSIYSQTPTATTLTTGVYSPVPMGQSFTGLNPAEKTGYIPFAGGGRAEVGLGGTNVRYPSNLGLMGGNIASGKIAPLPLEQISPMTSISRIEGGPASMNIAGPITAEAQGRQAIQTPRGTIYATAGQQQALGARTTAYEGRTPEQQQALLAQMRRTGAGMAKTMTEFAESRGPRFAPMAAPQGLYGQQLTGLFPQSKEVMPQSTNQATPSFASSSFGSGSITRPSQYSNERAEQRKQIRQLSEQYGLQRPLSRQIENQYRQRFSSMGFM